MTPIQLPEISRLALAQLYQQQKSAEQQYALALNATLAAVGLDPRLAHSFDLDTGIIQPAAQE
jgi:hypothetical protein